MKVFVRLNLENDIRPKMTKLIKKIVFCFKFNFRYVLVIYEGGGRRQHKGCKEEKQNMPPTISNF